MSYTLLYVHENELLSASYPGRDAALEGARDVLAWGGRQLSILDPSGREAILHEDIVRHAKILKRWRERFGPPPGGPQADGGQGRPGQAAPR
ncbi:hypothetical protein [Azospirillum sp. SYSU D00513]|uniref:hypothetical protein n=1 Tax=Azospirillum sp. SYSU D00513 TaxID=2812561 RepID=UPI001A9599B6|nr:hypothetical protein [Azospirillum sp. SYSU D00513]